MKQKLLLMLTLLVVAMGASAAKLYADLSKLSNGPVSTWDGSTNTMTWTATSNNMISNFDFAAGSYRAYSTISITVSGLDNAVGIRLQIKANGQEKLVALNGNGTFTKYLTDDFGFTTSDICRVEWIRVLGSAWQNGENHTIDADHPASAVISDVYLTEPTRTLNVNLSKMAASEDNATWNFSTKTFAWTLNYSNAITLPGLSGNLSSFTKINYETAAGSSEQFRILMYYNNGAAQTTYVAGVGSKSVTFESMGVTEENLAHVSAIKFSGASTASGDVTLNSFSLEGPLVTFIEESTVQEAPEGATDLNGMTGADSNKWSIAFPLVVGNGTQFGGNIDGDNKSVDISSADYIVFAVTDASNDAETYLRVFVSTESSNDNGPRVILYPHPIADYASVVDWTAENAITGSGIYAVKISDYPLLRGIKNKAYWQGSAGTITISMAYVGSGTPAGPVETPVLSGINAINDKYSTCFDVTGLSGSGLTYNTANPNALFIAKDGQLTNTNNVIVNGTCANLQLTDGYPFKAPANFTATSASYTTTIDADVKAGTLCLPFAAAIPEGVKAYTLAYTGGNEVNATEVEETIPANTPVLLNGTGDATFTGSSAAIAADAENVDGALTGVFATTFVPENSYVLQKQEEKIGFFKVEEANSIEAAPFRAYLTATSEARSLSIKFDEGGTTGISLVNNEVKANNRYFNLNGQRVMKPAKGLYIVNNKKVILK